MDPVSWIGQAVSITCDEKLGVFQGTIKDCNNQQLTIIRAFRNGVPLRKQDAEVMLTVTDIQKIELLPTYNTQSTVQQTVINKPTPVKQPNFGAVKKDKNESQLTSKMNNMKISNGYHHKRSSPINDKFPKVPSYNMPPSSFAPILQNGGQTLSFLCSGNSGNGQKLKTSPSSVAKFFGNLIPSKVEVKLGASLSTNPISNGFSNSIVIENNIRNNISTSYLNQTKPIEICNLNKLNNTPNKNNHDRKILLNKQSRRDTRQNVNIQTFGTPIDDSTMDEDFDFEGNLALFDKQAIWDTIESRQKPDVVRQAVSAQVRKYRHDENVISAEPTQLRQIVSYSQDSTDFVTDEGLIIPTIPLIARNKIQQNAQANGLSVERQCDILARGCTDLAILLLGGARRLTPNNRHQYPKITIITDKSHESLTASIIAAATGRFCASHGLKVYLYVKEQTIKNNVEFELFKATGNNIVNSINDLPSSDLVILSISTNTLPSSVKRWISENRSAVLAIDPPPTGITNVTIKCSILPILPVHNTSITYCGKLYLCNLGIPDKFYRETGCVKKYKSPFGSKFVIPIHMKND